MSAAPALAALRERLRRDADLGALHDGPRRYLMMRPDVLMGAVARLPAMAQREMFEALAASTREHGADSLRAYAASVGGDAGALMAATAQAAADLGWGVWSLQHEEEVLHLTVSSSPFAAGWPCGEPALQRALTTSQPEQPLRAGQPVCAPIRGMLEALAGIVLGTRATAVESECVACGAASCRFTALRAVT